VQLKNRKTKSGHLRKELKSSAPEENLRAANGNRQRHAETDYVEWFSGPAAKERMSHGEKRVLDQTSAKRHCPIKKASWSA